MTKGRSAQRRQGAAADEMSSTSGIVVVVEFHGIRSFVEETSAPIDQSYNLPNCGVAMASSGGG